MKKGADKKQVVAKKDKRNRTKISRPRKVQSFFELSFKESLALGFFLGVIATVVHQQVLLQALL